MNGLERMELNVRNGMDKGKEIVNEPFWMHPDDGKEIILANEYITKKQAIEALCEDCGGTWLCNDGMPVPCNIIKTIKNIPAADVQKVKKGQWKHWYSTLDNDYSRCTCCQKDVDGFANYSYCPNCGADMRR